MHRWTPYTQTCEALKPVYQIGGTPLLPFPLRGIDVDNDTAFLNASLEHWCEKHQPRIELTRSRAYQSNDQAWVGHPRESRESIPRDSLGCPVEQKNGMLVRRVVG